MKKHISDFYQHLIANDRFYRPSYGNPQAQKLHLLLSHLQSLPVAEFRKLISDPHWNSYPTYVYSYRKNDDAPNPRGHYLAISRVVKTLILISDKYRGELIRHSEGIFRMATISHTLGGDKLKAAKLGIKSRDTRVRKLSAKILPVKDLIPMLETEKNSSVLNKLASRIGSLNMIEAGKRSRYRWNRSEAFVNDSLDMEEIRSFLTKKSEGKSVPVYDRDILTKVIYHLSASELPFAFDVLNGFADRNSELKAIFMAKLTGQNDA